MNRTELQQFARDRLRDAKALLAARRWTGAYYLAGYAVECGLKACIARLMKAEEFPDKNFGQQCWTHDMERLVFLAGLKAIWDAKAKADPQFSARWGTVKDWTETSRYGRTAKAQALALYQAITDAKHGVLSWIKSHW